MRAGVPRFRKPTPQQERYNARNSDRARQQNIVVNVVSSRQGSKGPAVCGSASLPRRWSWRCAEARLMSCSWVWRRTMRGEGQACRLSGQRLQTRYDGVAILTGVRGMI